MSNTSLVPQNQALPEITEPQIDLDKLATTVRDAHLAVERADQNKLEQALRAGDALIAAKRGLGHGQWLSWLKKHCDLPERRAQRYMEIAAARDTLMSNPTRVSDLSLQGALRLIKPARQRTTHRAPKAPAKRAAALNAFDALKWWTEAPLKERRHFLDGAGLRPILEATPTSWREALTERVLGIVTTETLLGALAQKLGDGSREQQNALKRLRAALHETPVIDASPQPADADLDMPDFLRGAPPESAASISATQPTGAGACAR
jgi:hypothetical protein